MKIIIERIEDDYAVCEIGIGKFINIPKNIIPNAKEGDIIKIEIDEEETNKRKDHIEKLINNVFED